MAVVVHRTTVQVIYSAHAPDYPTGTWIHNPDLSALVAVPQKYWKVVGDLVQEMTAGEKAVVDGVESGKNFRRVFAGRVTYKLDFMAQAAYDLRVGPTYSKADITAVFTTIQTALTQMDHGLLEAARTTILATSTTALFTNPIRNQMAAAIQTFVDAE